MTHEHKISEQRTNSVLPQQTERRHIKSRVGIRGKVLVAVYARLGRGKQNGGFYSKSSSFPEVWLRQLWLPAGSTPASGKGERCRWQRATQGIPKAQGGPTHRAPQLALLRGRPQPALLATPLKGRRRAYVQQLEGRRPEQGFCFNGKTSRSSQSPAPSTPLLFLAKPTLARCPEDGLAGGERWVGALALLSSLSG